MAEEGFDLRWKNHLPEMFGVLRRVRQRDCFSDVALFCGGEHFRAHKVILAAGSSFFETLLAPIPPDRSQVLVIAGVSAKMLRLVLDFIYLGEVFIDTNSVDEFMETADKLEIRGLRRDPQDATEGSSNGNGEDGAAHSESTSDSPISTKSPGAQGAYGSNPVSVGGAGPSKRPRDSDDSFVGGMDRISASGGKLMAVPRKVSLPFICQLFIIRLFFFGQITPSATFIQVGDPRAQQYGSQNENTMWRNRGEGPSSDMSQMMGVNAAGMVKTEMHQNRGNGDFGNDDVSDDTDHRLRIGITIFISLFHLFASREYQPSNQVRQLGLLIDKKSRIFIEH